MAPRVPPPPPAGVPKLVILDRDGVVNEDSDAFIKSPEEWHPLPGSLRAIARMNQAGIRVALATNQSGIARGLYDLPTMHAIHRRMQSELAIEGGRIEAIFFCPHGPESECDCRKPRSGMVRMALERAEVPATLAVLVGDSLRDLVAAREAGVRGALVRTGGGAAVEEDAVAEGLTPGGVHDDLAAFVDTLALSPRD